MLVNKQADLTATDLSATMPRQLAIPFSMTLKTGLMSVFRKRPRTNQVSLSFYIDNFSLECWVAIGASMVMLSVAFSLIVGFEAESKVGNVPEYVRIMRV